MPGNATSQSTELFLAGIDEAGRGPLAGPVTAACVCLPPRYKNKYITDSKKLTALEREELFDEINSVAVAASAVSVGSKRIDRINILQATRLAMRLCAHRVYAQLLSSRSEVRIYFLIDGIIKLETKLPHEAIIKGDQKIMAVAAASILAKVTRDRLMSKLGVWYPGYGLIEHKGYGTEFHRSRIAELGPSRIHRKSFGGVREFVSFSGELQTSIFDPIVSSAEAEAFNDEETDW